MYSFSSASQKCEPLPRTINGGSAPTDLNARTGEFTPPGIMLSARCCRRRDCSVWRKVVEGINSSRPGENRCQSNWDVSVYYSSGRIHQIFTNLQSVCNISAVPWGHQVTLLTGRVFEGQSRGLRTVLFAWGAADAFVRLHDGGTAAAAVRSFSPHPAFRRFSPDVNHN